MVLESLQRLSTFAEWPMLSDACSGITNFVSKAAAAHFERTAECVDDEVVCKSCGVSYKHWTNESPAAVHRTISPKCPAMNPSSSKSPTCSECSSLPTDLSSLQQNPFLKFLPDRSQNQIAGASLQTEDSRTPERASGTAGDQELPADQTPEQQSHSSRHQGADGVRRVLFPDPDVDHSYGIRNPPPGATASNTEGPQNLEFHSESESSEARTKPPSVLDQLPITHPFPPKSGGYNNLFASNRLKTFPAPTISLKHQAWAEEGFIFREMKEDLSCVFCGTVMVVNGHRPKVAHAKACPSCPFVMGFDVGNITLQQEKDIRLKYFGQQAVKKHLDQDLMIVKFPHYEKEEERLGSFVNWPKVFEKLFPSKIRASAGFFYKGPIDKVACYCCGVELYDWSEESDVWVTHARVSPTCLHVISQKGQEFIKEAANTEIKAEVIYPGKSNRGSLTGNNGVIGEEPGSCNLDMTAVKAALACGYTLPQIQHAIVKFFCQTSRYPNEAILKASLKASDENHVTICKQQQAIHQRDSELERKEKDVQHKDTQLQETHAVIQEQGTVIQHKDTVIQQSHTQLQRVIEEKEQIAQEKDALRENMSQQLQTQDQQLQMQDQQLQTQDQQLQMQDQQIQSLMQQVQQLRADDHNRAHPGPAGDAAHQNNHHHSLVCKICQSDKPRMIFLPCGHLFCCAECTPRLPDRRCPVCRQDISKVLPAFVA